MKLSEQLDKWDVRDTLGHPQIEWASWTWLKQQITQLEADRDALVRAVKPVLDRGLPHKWRGTIEIQCTPDEFLTARNAIKQATRKEVSDEKDVIR